MKHGFLISPNAAVELPNTQVNFLNLNRNIIPRKVHNFKENSEKQICQAVLSCQTAIFQSTSYRVANLITFIRVVSDDSEIEIFAMIARNKNNIIFYISFDIVAILFAFFHPSQ